MKTARYGRILFGASAVLFGIIALAWHDADTWQTPSKLWSLPFGTVLGAALMIAQIGGGVGIQFPRTVRVASIVLIVVYAVFSLAGIPGIIATPHVYQSYGSFFEDFALLSGALAVYATTGANAVWRRAARIGLGLSAVSFALEQAFYLRETASFVPRWIPPSPMFWAILTTVAFALAALAILINRQSRLALRLLTLMIALFGVLVWIPALIAHPSSHGSWSEFTLTFLIAGASWVVSDATS